MAGDTWPNAQLFGVQAHFSSDLCGLNYRKQQVPRAHEVVAGSREGKTPRVLFSHSTRLFGSLRGVVNGETAGSGSPAEVDYRKVAILQNRGERR